MPVALFCSSGKPPRPGVAGRARQAAATIAAAANFCMALGYSLDEIKGRHHRMFVAPAEASGRDYQQFWDSLRRGEFLLRGGTAIALLPGQLEGLRNADIPFPGILR